MKGLLSTEDSVPLFFVRVGLAVVMFPHGAQKVLGWFGGHGFSGTLKAMTEQGLPAIAVVLVMMAELLGSLGPAVGLLSRIAAGGIAAVMLGALFLVHLPNGFFMNWFGQQQGEGFEYHLLVLAMTAAVMAGGSGRWSLDRAIAARARTA